MLFDYVIEIWLLVGLLSLIVEFLQFPGIGFLFLGLGALSNAILIHIYPGFAKDQYTCFGLLSFAWFLLLWWPLKKYAGRSNKKQESFGILGAEVELVSDLLPGDMGQVKWSGTIMNARLDHSETKIAEVGQRLYIKAVEGNVLILVSTKN